MCRGMFSDPIFASSGTITKLLIEENSNDLKRPESLFAMSGEWDCYDEVAEWPTPLDQIIGVKNEKNSLKDKINDVIMKQRVQPFNPVPKFIIIKSVVFLTYWQGVLVFLAAKYDLIKNAEDAAEFQNFIICVEMLIAAVGHLYAFPYKEYAGANVGASHAFTASLAHALMLNDFYHDTVHQFAPTYHDYVLYNHSSDSGEENGTKYRARTFVPMGPEMDNARKSWDIASNKLDDIQLSRMSSSSDSLAENNYSPVQKIAKSESVGSSLLVDVSNSSSIPLDLTLVDLNLSSYLDQVPSVTESDAR
ncbi:uncharacterized protein [Rutidosis leptorrhynchoides]|uniref:uncharacterized protein n=1 Tax=Rutidosis leptorrhynchoides TaxID=125765 RepID=UPI003A99C8C3